MATDAGVLETAAGESTLRKVPSGIAGLDEITGGGLPQGRTVLVCGGAGSGKTVFAAQFLVRGALDYDEPGVFMSFEETAEELTANVASLGLDLPDLVDRQLLVVQHVLIERAEIEETGEYDLEGLFVRMAHAIEAVGAKRVALDTIEAIFSGFESEAICRAELRRLFRWLKERGVTTIVTAERGVETLTRHGLEEYLSDCVIVIDHRVEEQISTRRLKILKYRGSGHGTNEYPFLIDEDGFSVLPITSLGLDHPVTTERVSSGVPRLDAVLGGEGIFRGSTVLISGTAGTGKSSLAAQCAAAACARGERCLYFLFEESPAQVVRNMRSIGVDLEPWIRDGRLRFMATRPTLYGLEMHLAGMHKAAAAFRPDLVILDPVTNFISAGTTMQVRGMLMRLVDFLKSRAITTVMTSLTSAEHVAEQTETEISSLIDTWILLHFIEANGERNRALYVLKSRGTAHSNQVREFLLTDHGIEVLDVYLGPSGVLTGSARYVQEAREHAEAAERREELERLERQVERRRAAIEREVAALREEFEAEEEERLSRLRQAGRAQELARASRTDMARLRRAESPPREEVAGDGRREGANER